KLSSDRRSAHWQVPSSASEGSSEWQSWWIGASCLRSTSPCGPAFQNANHRVGHEDPVTSAGRLADDAFLHQGRQRMVRGRKGNAELLADLGDGYHRLADQPVDQLAAG